MSNFFTPLEVCPNPKQIVQAYDIDKYHNDPFQPTSIKIESISDHRRKIIQWLKSMPVHKRVEQLTFTNKQFSCLMMAMHQRIQDRNNLQYEFAIFHDRLQQKYQQLSGFRLVDDRLIKQPDENRLSAQYRLIKSIVIVHRYTHFDSVTLDQSLVSDVDKLFDLFEVIENGVSQQLNPSSYQKYKKQDSTIIFYDSLDCQGVTKSIGSWMVEVMKKNISVKFFSQHFEKSVTQTSNFPTKNEQRISKKFKLFKKYWKHMNLQEKQKVVVKTLTKDISKIVGSYRQNIRLEDFTFPKIMRSQYQEVDDFKFYIIHNNGQVLLKNLMYTHLNGAAQSLSVYKYELMVDLEQFFQKKQTQSVPPFCKKKSNKEEIAMSPNIEKEKNQLLYSPVSKAQNNQSARSPKQEQGKKSQQKIEDEKDIYINGKKLQKKSSKKGTNKTNKVTFNIESPTKEEQERQISPVFSQEIKPISQATNDRDQSQQSQNSRISCHEKFIQEELDKINKQISQQATAYHKYRELALKRIHQILKRYSLSFKVFGSHACGLAIPSSDIDICVDPTIVNYFIVSFREYRDKIIMALQFLRDIFRQTPWSSKFNLISTAVVPVLMFEINLGIPHGDPREQAFNLSRRKQITVQVDFTIQLYVNMTKEIIPHLGYDSTILIKEWVSHDSVLTSAIILLKHIFHKYNLNKGFTGGMSSFALVTLVYTFYRVNLNTSFGNVYEFLKAFTHFLAQFNAQNLQINICEQNPISKKKIKDNRLMILNPINKKNLTQNCYKFGQIQKIMKQLSEILRPSQLQTQKQSKKNLRTLFFN